MDRTTIELLDAKEAGAILGINASGVYKLWKAGLLDFWCISGTRKTNLQSIAEFLEKTRNISLQEEG